MNWEVSIEPVCRTQEQDGILRKTLSFSHCDLNQLPFSQNSTSTCKNDWQRNHDYQTWVAGRTFLKKEQSESQFRGNLAVFIADDAMDLSSDS